MLIFHTKRVWGSMENLKYKLRIPIIHHMIFYFDESLVTRVKKKVNRIRLKKIENSTYKKNTNGTRYKIWYGFKVKWNVNYWRLIDASKTFQSMNIIPHISILIVIGKSKKKIHFINWKEEEKNYAHYHNHQNEYKHSLRKKN